MAPPIDVLIIGGGIAGLSAVSTIVRQNHSVVVLDSQQYRNGESPHMHTLATWDHRSPADWRAAARKDFERYGNVTIENVRVDTVEKLENGLFRASTIDGNSWMAKKLSLATGIEGVLPHIPGYAESWISGIFHCLYCHGWEESGTPSSGILAEGECAAVMPVLHFARQALRFSGQVTLYTHGNTQLGEDLEASLKTCPAPIKIDTRKIVKLEKGPQRSEIILHFEDRTTTTEGFLAHKPKSVVRGNLHEQLGLALGPKGTVLANPPFNQSSVKGVFVAGDMSAFMQTVTAALASGTASGAGAPLQIQAEMWNQVPLF